MTVVADCPPDWYSQIPHPVKGRQVFLFLLSFFFSVLRGMGLGNAGVEHARMDGSLTHGLTHGYIQLVPAYSWVREMIAVGRMVVNAFHATRHGIRHIGLCCLGTDYIV
ncbi:hypothetical protein B0H66DRAFT_380712 [Apodospora peruviana]|uniref:Uncharacterized protein n=1 Tax=Apodospora peruviana TaxID=516989 RepID=A0AAE0HTT8_9PEZI|nr:hypothetical protein B0H66DRAFT_380712 [Apodospora peruviana]